MIRSFLIAGVVGVMLSGFAFASENDEMNFRCRFRGDNDVKKVDTVCFARGEFDRTPVDQPTMDRHQHDRMKVVCDEVEIYDDGMRVHLVPDQDDVLVS